MHNRVALGIAVLASFALGCRDDGVLTSLRQRPQTQFVLRTVGGNPLPAVGFSMPGFTTTILADTLTLRNDGSGEQRARQVYRDSRADTLFVPLRYTLNGPRIDVQILCPVRYPCLQILYSMPHLLGEVTVYGIRFDRATGDRVTRVPLVYERLR